MLRQLLLVMFIASLLIDITVSATLGNVNFHIQGDEMVTISYDGNMMLVSRNESMYIPSGTMVTIEANSVNENSCIYVNGMRGQDTFSFLVNGSSQYNVTVTGKPSMVFLKVIYYGNGSLSVVFQNGTSERIVNGTPLALPMLSIVRLEAHPSNGYVANWSDGLTTDEIWCSVYQNQTLTLSFTRDPSSHTLTDTSSLVLNTSLGGLLLGFYLFYRHEKKKEEML